MAQSSALRHRPSLARSNGRETASLAIQRVYKNMMTRLSEELSKAPRDRWVLNNIRAFTHILDALEARYDIGPLATNRTALKS